MEERNVEVSGGSMKVMEEGGYSFRGGGLATPTWICVPGGTGGGMKKRGTSGGRGGKASLEKIETKKKGNQEGGSLFDTEKRSGVFQRKSLRGGSGKQIVECF